MLNLTKNANKKKIFETKNVSHFLSSQAFFEVKATTTGLHFLKDIPRQQVYFFCFKKHFLKGHKPSLFEGTG
jgi:hypothetical protein